MRYLTDRAARLGATATRNVAESLRELLADHATYDRTRNAALVLARPYAAREIAAELLEQHRTRATA